MTFFLRNDSISTVPSNIQAIMISTKNVELIRKKYESNYRKNRIHMILADIQRKEVEQNGKIANPLCGNTLL